MKEKQIQSLRHQLHMRDEIIARSKRLLEEHSIKYEFDESSFLKRSFDQSASHPANSSNSALQSGAKAQINHPFTIQKYTKTSGQHGNKGNISQDESTNFIPYNPANYSSINIYIYIYKYKYREFVFKTTTSGQQHKHSFKAIK